MAHPPARRDALRGRHDRPGVDAGLPVEVGDRARLAEMLDSERAGWSGALLSQPAAWSVPLGFAVMVAVSLATPHRVAPNVARTMVRLHTPEPVAVDRGTWRPRGT